MLRALFEYFRRQYFVLQAVALTIWLLLELCGYGFGILQGLFRPRLTDADSNALVRFLGLAPPPGPIRLARSERAALQDRIRSAFGEQPPRSVSLTELRYMYALKPGSPCDWRDASIASDPRECNQLTDATPLFRALLASMHPKTETLMLLEKRGYKGDMVTAAFFVGTSGRPSILFDFSRVRSDQWAKENGFALKVYHPNGLSDVDLGKELTPASSIYLIDDPGRLDRRRGLCGLPTCPSQLLLYGFSPREVSNGGTPSPRNLVEFDIDDDLEKRFALYAALMDTRPISPKALPPEPYKVARIEVTKLSTAKLDRAIDNLFEQGARARVLYSPIGYDVAFGTVYGVKLDDKYFTIWDGGDSFPSLGTDRFVFNLVLGGKARRIDDVRCHGVICFVPFSNTAPASAIRLEVRKFIDQASKPWSEFSEFVPLFEPLRLNQ